jgi:60 kDa SS-A/Ro ribonucleoprotein
MVTVRTEPNHYAMGFSTQFVDLGITARDSLVDVIAKTRDRNFGGTDTSVAIDWALRNKVQADAIVIYSDGETWAGDQHTFHALEQYRRKTGVPTRLAVVNFTATGRSIADQTDPLSMDFVGMDASLPQALRAFVAE